MQVAAYIGLDYADSTAPPCELAIPLHTVAAAREPVAGLARNPRLQIDATRIVSMGLERIGMAIRNEARRLYRYLWIHAEDEYVEKHLQVGLYLHVTARSPERHGSLALAHSQARIRRQTRTLAWR